MPQCENHNDFMQIALSFDWTLWEYGTDTTCEQYPKQVPIWIRPDPADTSQKEPVGCLCCTDLNVELVKFHQEMRSWFQSRLYEADRDVEDIMTPAPHPYEELEHRPVPLGGPSPILPPYRAR